MVYAFTAGTTRTTRSRLRRDIIYGVGHTPPLICAHGGDTTSAPPNTKRAFQAALDLGADCVEVDVARTKDGVLAVLHLRELDQLLGQRKGLQVGDFLWADLQRLHWPEGDEVMLVEQAVAMAAPHVAAITLDLKTYNTEAGQAQDAALLVVAVEQLLDQVHCPHCVVWAKSDALVTAIKQALPAQRVGYVVMNDTAQARQGGFHRVVRMPAAEVAAVQHSMVDATLVQELRTQGKLLFTWTADTAEALQGVLDAGVDGIVTNQPRLARSMLQELQQQCTQQEL